MNYNKIYFFGFVYMGIILFSTSSCETDMIVDFELPEPEKKLVL